MTTQTLTDILVIRRPDGTTFQVAGTKEDLELLCEMMKELPKEVRGEGTLVEIDDDAIFEASDGREIMRISHGNSIEIPDARHLNLTVDEVG